MLPSTAVLYVGYRYGWGSTAIGFMLAAAGISAMIVQGVLIKPITARFGERKTLLAGLCCGAIGFCVYGFASNGWIYCAGIPVMGFWGLAGPAVQALMTRRVSASEQGQLQGAIAGLSGIAGLIGPGLFTQTFAFFIGASSSQDVPHSSFHISNFKLWLGPLPGAPFLLASLLLVIGMVLAWRATKTRG